MALCVITLWDGVRPSSIDLSNVWRNRPRSLTLKSHFRDEAG